MRQGKGPVLDVLVGDVMRTKRGVKAGEINGYDGCGLCAGTGRSSGVCVCG